MIENERILVASLNGDRLRLDVAVVLRGVERAAFDDSVGVIEFQQALVRCRSAQILGERFPFRSPAVSDAPKRPMYRATAARDCIVSPDYLVRRSKRKHMPPTTDVPATSQYYRQTAEYAKAYPPK